MLSYVLLGIEKFNKRGLNLPFTMTQGIPINMGAYFKLEILNYSSTVHEIIWSVLDEMISKLDYKDCVIYLLDDQSNSLYQCAAYGEKRKPYNQIVNPISIPIGKGIVGETAQSKQSLLIPDTRNHESYILDLTPGLAEIAVPIFYRDQILGVIDSESDQLNYYSDTDLKMLSDLASYISYRIVAEFYRDNLLKKISKQSCQMSSEEKKQ